MARGLGQASTAMSGGPSDPGDDGPDDTGLSSNAVSALQAKANSGSATVVPPSTSTMPSDDTSDDDSSLYTGGVDVDQDTTNAALIAGQNADKIDTVSTQGTNALLYGIGALVLGGLVVYAIEKSRPSRRRR